MTRSPRPSGRLLLSAALAAVAVCGAVVAIAAGTGAAAQKNGERLIGRYQDWEANVSRVDGNKVCWVATVPKKTLATVPGRGEVVLMVSHWPARKLEGLVQFNAGYTFEKGTTVMMQVAGRKPETFLPRGSSAWARNPELDKRMVRYFINGSTVTVIGKSETGPLTKDVFSLSGFTAAYKAATRACK